MNSNGVVSDYNSYPWYFDAFTENAAESQVVMILLTRCPFYRRLIHVPRLVIISVNRWQQFPEISESNVRVLIIWGPHGGWLHSFYEFL